MKIEPDRTASEVGGFDRVVVLEHEAGATEVLDSTLADIAIIYGKSASDWLALQLEYPDD